MRKTGMVLNEAFPSDIRLEKQINSLIRLGYEVHLLSYGSSKVWTPDEGAGAFFHHRIFTRSPRIQWTLKFIDRVFLVNPIWIWLIFSFLKKSKVSLLHVHDLPIFGLLFMLLN